MASAYRYDDIGTVNSVKLIPKINSYNGYIQLYTELDSHIEVGDNVLITYSGDTAELGDINLDNVYYSLQSDGFLYNNYAQGYNVLYVNKNTNSFVIDRLIFTLPANSKIYGHYVSAVSASNIVITDGDIDGTFMKNGTIEPTTNVDVRQIIMLNGEMFDIDISDKYSTGYISLLLDYDSTTNNYKKYSNINNNEYGYSYFYGVEIKDCNFYCGLYYDCEISSTDISKKIDGGYFSNCYIDNYEIYNAYMNNIVLSDNCEWIYGRWDGGIFTLSTWQNGIFINGTFGNDNNAIWENGTFYNGVWSGLYWINGDFVGGQFKGQDNSINGDGQIVYTEWLAGNFIDGEMYNADFYTGIGNSFYVKDIKISGGNVYNASIYGGNINGGNIYNSSIKNCNICDGNFISNLQGVDYYNRIANCNIYGGNFVGEWWSPIYLESNSEFTGSTYGLNEISESTIYNGVFKYSHFYSYNEIKNGNFDSCLFLSPIVVRDGVFKNGKLNYIQTFDGVSGYTITKSQKSNYFGSEKFNFSKASIRRKELLNSSNVLVSKILLEFDNGHNFSDGDSGKTINLVGFKSQELWNSEYTILSSDTYYDPTTYGFTGNVLPYEYFEPVGDSYIVLDEVYEEWFYNDSGIVRKVDYYDLLTEYNDSFYQIYNGKYSNCYMRGVEIPEQTAIDDDNIDTDLPIGNTTYGNIKIYYGEFKTSYLQNGVVWINGTFDGGLFVSDFGIGPENHWYNGNFYGGTFGTNSGGDLETLTLSIWNNNAYIIDKSGTTGDQTDDWRLVKIYPLYLQQTTLVEDINMEIEDFIDSWGAGSFLPTNRTLSQQDNSNFTNDFAKNTMNVEPWSEQNIISVSPYEFIFVVSCSDDSARIKLKSALDSLSLNYDNSYIGLIDTTLKNEPVLTGNTEYMREPYKLFERLFTDNYSYNYVDKYIDEVENLIYIRFRFNEIEKLYANSTSGEFDHFNKNYRSVWSLANTGYYTHPMPVLDENETNYGYDDLAFVGKFVIYGSSSFDENSDWIYGTCPPPWWYSVPVGGIPSINWSNANVGTITRISTKKSNNSQIQNNNTDVEFFEIEFDDILLRLQNSWIMRDLYGVDDEVNNQYPGDFRHRVGVTTSRDNTPIPYRKNLVEWYRHYIYLNKNKTGFNCSPKIKYTNVHDEQKTKQLLYDPSFNNVEDYKTEPIWDLGGIQAGRINKSASEYNRPAMIYNTKAYNAKLIGNKLYFNNNVNFSDRNEENLFNFTDGWDKYIRVTKRTISTQLDFTSDTNNTDNIVVLPNLDIISEQTTNPNTSTELSDRIVAESIIYERNVTLQSDITTEMDRAERGGFYSLPPTPSYSSNIFENGTYEVLDVSGYSYVDGELQNYLTLKVPDEYITDNLVIDVEVFKQNRGIIMPYFYKVENNTNWLSQQDSIYGGVGGGGSARLISYKDYGQKLALKMEPIFHNYAFNGKISFENNVSAATFDNRNIFGVRIIKLVPDGGNIIKNNHYRIIFNSLYENPEQIFEQYASSSINEPLVGAYSFYDSNKLPDFNDRSYFVNPTDLLQSLRYSDTSDNWISILDFSKTAAYTYNDFLTNNIFIGTWKVANSGLTGISGESTYYGDVISSAGGSPIFDDTYPNRVYFDIVDSDLNVNQNISYPTLLLDEGSIFQINSTVWGVPQFEIENFGTTTNAINTANNFQMPDIAQLTNNILNYTSGNSSINYTRFSSGFNPYVFFHSDLNIIIDSIKNDSTIQNKEELFITTSLSSYTDFRIKSFDFMAPSSTVVPTTIVPNGSIRFPDEEVSMSGITRRTGSIWIKKPGAWESKWYNEMDRHYKLTIKIIKRKLYTTETVLNETGTTISVIFGDRIFTKNGDDVIVTNSFPTIEFEIYHHLIKGEQWTDDFIGVVLENAEFDTGCINEYYITEMKLEYDPLNFVDMFATLEPEVECAGRIVKMRTKYGETAQLQTHKTISTKILDYDWINKSYIFDIDAETSDLENFVLNDIYLATNMRSYNIFDFPVSDVSIYASTVGYTGVKKWVLPSWSTNTNPTITEINKKETIYQNIKGDNFSKKDCMMEIRYLSNYKYVEGTGADPGNEIYHDSMGDHYLNKPVDYSIISNGIVKETQMSLINLSDQSNLGKEYFDYGVLNIGMDYQIFVDYESQIGFGAFPNINTAIFLSELTDEGQQTELNNLTSVENISTNGYYIDNVNYWFGPLRSYFGATVANSDIQDSEHPAYWTGCFWRLTGGPSTPLDGIYEGNSNMPDNYSDNNYDYEYKYYTDSTYSTMYSFNNGNSPWNMVKLRGWKHIGRWMNASLASSWISGVYEGNTNLQGNYVDLFKTIPTSDSGLESVLPTDGVAVYINQPNIYFAEGYNDDIRTVVKCVRIVEKVDIEEFDTIIDDSTNSNYLDFRIDGFNGMNKFGLEMWRQNDVFRIMSHNYLFSYSNYEPEYNVVWFYEIENFTERHNFHDVALFNAYHISKIDDNDYQNVLFNRQDEDYDFVDSDARMIYNMFRDMRNESNEYENISQYSEYFTDEIKDKFEIMNAQYQTSVQNFNKKSGIQLHTVNVGITPASYTDNWYDGTFYDGTFQGKWYGGRWINGLWIGYNFIAASNSGQSDYFDLYLDQLSSPDFVNIGFVEKEPYDENYELLKKKKLYYEISPWDDASKKNNEVVKLPLRKKERKL